MNLSPQEILKRLGAGVSIAGACEAAGLSRAQFDAWWQAEIRSCVPTGSGIRPADVRRSVEIERDTWGVPHIYADNDEDLLFGFGYAVAQDRLFQLDYLRRRGGGRLASVNNLDTFASSCGRM
jgi:acyl-homoserine lactone acylase PvdQ